jgi:hypothetical protein
MSEAYNKDRTKQKAKVIKEMAGRTKTMLDVKNFTSERTSKAIPNQFIITDGKRTTTFKSYNSIIAEQRGAGGGFDDVVIFGKDYNYSTTTSKYLNKFLEMIGYKEIANSRDREKAIERGMFYSGNKAIYVSVDDTL